MSLALAFLTPLAFFLPMAGLAESSTIAGESSDPVSVDVWQGEPGAEAEPQSATDNPVPAAFQAWPQQFVTRSFYPDNAFQVRIEQSIRIRIAPRPNTSSSPVQPNMLLGVPNRSVGTSFVEKRMGKCVKVKSIAGVQASRGSDLILYLNDRRMVRAELERACRARDFYSGFYLSGNSDGRLCVDRDSLQSRSGANCKLTEMRQLVEADN